MSLMAAPGQTIDWPGDVGVLAAHAGGAYGAAHGAAEASVSRHDAKDDEASEERLVIALGVMLLLCVSTSYIYSLPRLRRFKLYFTEPAAQIVVGMLCWVLLPVFPRMHAALRFEPDTFFLFLLPPIIFASGYNMKAQVFFSNIGVIFFLGILGTLACTVLMTCALYVLSDRVLTVPLSLEESLLFANSLSAVDSIATVSVFTQLGVPSMTFTLVFGESVVNDAAAIVAYDSFKGIIVPGGSGISLVSSITCLAKIAGVCVGSISIGIVCGAACALVLKHTSIHREPPLEIAVFWIFPLLSYFSAEILSMSGVMSILFCGSVMGHYTYFNLSLENQVSTPVSTTIVAFLSESFVFLYLGGAMPDAAAVIAKDFGGGGGGGDGSLGLLLLSFVLCYASRGLVVLAFCFCANLWRRKPINWKMQVVMWIGGAMRGAVSYALALKVTSENKIQIYAATLFVVAASTLIAGAGTTLLIRGVGSGASLEESKGKGEGGNQETRQRKSNAKLRLNMDGSGASEDATDVAAAADAETSPLIIKKARAPKTSGGGGGGPARIGLWRRLDETYFIPILRVNGDRRVSSVPYISPCKGVSKEDAALIGRAVSPLSKPRSMHLATTPDRAMASPNVHDVDDFFNSGVHSPIEQITQRSPLSDSRRSASLRQRCHSGSSTEDDEGDDDICV